MTVSYFREIALMMHGFGDSCEPRAETVRLVEIFVLRQIKLMVNAASEQADRCGSKNIQPEHIAFLLRRNPLSMQRLLRYLKMKQTKRNIMKVETDSPDVFFETQKPENNLTKFVLKIDETNELSDLSDFDPIKYERTVRADRMSVVLNEAKYLEFFKARCASFIDKENSITENINLFCEWIGPSTDTKITNGAVDLLFYVAHETVAEIVDCAFLVRNDMKKKTNDPLSSLSTGNYCNPVSFNTSQIDKKFQDGSVALTPNEIREAIRRFGMTQVGQLMSSNGFGKKQFMIC